jgi:hypothetical protein
MDIQARDTHACWAVEQAAALVDMQTLWVWVQTNVRRQELSTPV